MKLLRRITGLAATLAVLMALAVPQAAGEGYTYTVRIYAGQQGTMVGSGNNGGRISESGNMLICENVPYGNQIIFHNNMVELNDGSKYYVKGIRESGKGTDEVSETGGSQRVAAFTVDKDQDYVVAYGVLTNPVAYTVNYQTAAGRELAPSETYYGNIGDRPVIAYQYIEGYQPQAYNLTKTLSKDPAENVFTFIYSPLPENTVYTNTTTTVVSGTNPTTPPNTSSTVSGESSASSANESSAPSAPPESSSQPNEDISDNSVPVAEPPASESPAESWDLDDGPVPMASFNGDDGKLDSDGKMLWNHIPLAAKITGGVAMLGCFSVALWLLIFRRRRKDEE